MKQLVLCIFALMASSVEETVETYPQGSWVVNSESASNNDLSKVQLTSSSGSSSTSPTNPSYTTLLQTEQTDSPQHYKLPTKLHAIDGNAVHSSKYLPTFVKHVPIFINEKQSPVGYAHQTHNLFSPETYSYQDAQPFFIPAAQIPQMNTLLRSLPVNQIQHLAQLAHIPQVSSYAPFVKVPHVQHMLSIPQYSHIGVPAIAHPSSIAPFEHIPSIVKQYPVYFKEPQQSLHFDVESHPNSESNYWNPESFNPFHGLQKPSKFHCHNNPDPYESVHTVLKPLPYYMGEKQYPNSYGVSRSGSWTSETGGYHEQNSRGFTKHKNFLIKRKQSFV